MKLAVTLYLMFWQLNTLAKVLNTPHEQPRVDAITVVIAVSFIFATLYLYAV